MGRPNPGPVEGGRPGEWPNGEAQSVRDAYDKLLAQQSSGQKPKK